MSDNSRLPKIDLAGVAARLEALRATTGLTKDDFAKSFGYDPSSYTKTLKGTKPLQSQHAYAAAEIWGVTMDYFFRGDLSKIEPETRAKIMAALNKPLP